MDKNIKFNFLIVLMVGILFIVGLWVHGREMAGRNINNILTVTGSTKTTVTADLAKWSSSFSRQTTIENLGKTLKEAENDQENFLAMVSKIGLSRDSVNFQPVQIDPYYEDNKIVGRVVRQDVSVESIDIGKIEALNKKTSEITATGVLPEYQRIEYFYTKLSDLRPELYAEATKDAKVRAQALADVTGAKVFGIQSAKTGVIQILPPNSTDVSDYGSYDLSTKEKEISATVSVAFKLK